MKVFLERVEKETAPARKEVRERIKFKVSQNISALKELHFLMNEKRTLRKAQTEKNLQSL